MRIIRFITEEGKIYVSTKAKNANDIAISEPPETFGYAYNRETNEWEVDEERVKNARISEIYQELSTLDQSLPRPLAEIADPTIDSTQSLLMVQSINAQKAVLRAERSTLLEEKTI